MQVAVYTVPLQSIRQSRVTEPQNLPKCHDGHGYFAQVPKTAEDFLIFECNLGPKMAIFTENFRPSRRNMCPAETKISVGPSRVTGPAELIIMVQ